MIDFNLSLSTYVDLLIKIYYKSSEKFIAYAPLFDDSDSSNNENSSDELDNTEELSVGENMDQNQKLFDLSILHNELRRVRYG